MLSSFLVWKTLPEWLENLTSLQSLFLSFLPKLRNSPYQFLQLMTCPSFDRVMEQVRGFEHLPEDALRNILVRVAKEQTGAADIVNVLAASKYFQSFSNDSDIMRAVSFKDFSRGLHPRYELFCEVRGLLVSCASVGHPDARVMLAKVALLSASSLLNAQMEAGNSIGYPMRYLIDLNKATHLINYLSVGNKDMTELIELIRLFLARARVPDLIEMGYFLGDFVTLFSSSWKEAHQETFIATLDQICDKSSQRTFVLSTINELCSTGHSNMVAMGIDEAQIRPLLECVMDMNELVALEILNQHLDIVERILRLGGHVESTPVTWELICINTSQLYLADELRVVMQELIEHENLVETRHRGLALSSFDAIFCT